MATKKAQKKAAPKKAVAKPAKKAQKAKQYPSNKFEALDKARKASAARQGWETRRKSALNKLIKKVEDKSGVTFVGPNTAIAGEQKPVGTITGLASINEASSLELGVHIASLYNRLRIKLSGTENPIVSGKEKEFSASVIVGSLERTRENLEWALETIKEIDNLQDRDL